ncbi:hypothetical protein C8R43DRAFT_1115943 [Mycena crocata]|nr:hypothetical protein C8R43DRAFT_1115943 [Mycena crocata]
MQLIKFCGLTTILAATLPGVTANIEQWAQQNIGRCDDNSCTIALGHNDSGAFAWTLTATRGKRLPTSPPGLVCDAAFLATPGGDSCDSKRPFQLAKNKPGNYTVAGCGGELSVTFNNGASQGTFGPCEYLVGTDREVKANLSFCNMEVTWLCPLIK